MQRLILGIVEAGTFPGMWMHITVFHSAEETGPALAVVATSTALSQVIGAPIAAGERLLCFARSRCQARLPALGIC